MNKRHFVLALLLVISFLVSGCDRTTKNFQGEEAGKTINPLDAGSMVDTYEESKVRIQDAVDKEQKKIDDALESSDLME